MIIHDLNPGRPTLRPDKADSPLIVDADVVLPLARIFERLQPICGRDAQVIQGLSLVEHEELAQGNLLYLSWESARDHALPNLFRLSAVEIKDHGKL